MLACILYLLVSSSYVYREDDNLWQRALPWVQHLCMLIGFGYEMGKGNWWSLAACALKFIWDKDLVFKPHPITKWKEPKQVLIISVSILVCLAVEFWATARAFGAWWNEAPWDDAPCVLVSAEQLAGKHRTSRPPDTRIVWIIAIVYLAMPLAYQLYKRVKQRKRTLQRQRVPLDEADAQRAFETRVRAVWTLVQLKRSKDWEWFKRWRQENWHELTEFANLTLGLPFMIYPHGSDCVYCFTLDGKHDRETCRCWTAAGSRPWHDAGVHTLERCRLIFPEQGPVPDCCKPRQPVEALDSFEFSVRSAWMLYAVEKSVDNTWLANWLQDLDKRYGGTNMTSWGGTGLLIRCNTAIYCFADKHDEKCCRNPQGAKPWHDAGVHYTEWCKLLFPDQTPVPDCCKPRQPTESKTRRRVGKRK
jgi:hypothetical protein